MKKLMGFVLLIFMTLTVATAHNTNEITIYINYQKATFMDQSPYIDTNNRVLIPLRFISESLGAQVEWDKNTQMISIKKAEDSYDTVRLVIGEKVISVNGEFKEMDAPAILTDKGRTMVPLRFVVEALGQQVDWDEHSRAVLITYSPHIKKVHPHEKSYEHFEDLYKELLNYYRSVLENIVGVKEPYVESLFTVSQQHIDYNKDNEKSEVYFLAFDINEESSQHPLLYDPGFFVYSNGITKEYEVIKITGAMEFGLDNYIIRYEDIDGDEIPEIFYSVDVIVGGSSINFAHPHYLKYDTVTGKFIDINIFEKTDYFIADWGFEDIDDNGVNELWLDVQETFIDEPIRKFFTLTQGNLAMIKN